MGDLDHHPDEYLSVVKLSILTAHATWWRGWYKPHTGPEAFAAMRQNEVRTTKHNHTPSSKAGQPRRHRCNQIPRGRDQRTNWARAPHGTTAGGREATSGREGSRQQPKTKNENNGAQPNTERSATETERHQKTHRQKHQTDTTKSPERQSPNGIEKSN